MENEAPNSTEYELAYAAINAATAVFHQVQRAYREQRIGDTEYLAARAEYEAAESAFDEVMYRELST